MPRQQSTTFLTLVTLIFTCSIADAASPSARSNASEVAQFTSSACASVPNHADDPDPEQQWWDNLRALVDMLCRLIACDQPANSASFDHSIVFVNMQSQIDAFSASGLRQGLTQADRTQGKVVAASLADEIDLHPGRFDASLRGEYRKMLDEVIVRLQIPTTPAPGAESPD